MTKKRTKFSERPKRVSMRQRFVPASLYLSLAAPFIVLAGGSGSGLYLGLGHQLPLSAGVAGGIVGGGAGISAYFYKKWLKSKPCFLRQYRRYLLYRFLFQNGYVFEKQVKTKEGIKTKRWLPKVFIQQEAYAFSVSFPLEGNKFQERFLRIGGELETMYEADLMGHSESGGYITYFYAVASRRGRLSAKDVRVEGEKGLKLAEGVYWDFIHDPHLILAGGTGGGKTVLLRSLLVGLARVGVVEICDPKQADFVSLAKLAVFKKRVTWETEEIAQRIVDFRDRMDSRYAKMRELSAQKNEKELGSFRKYGFRPAFIMIDEFPSFNSALDELSRKIGFKDENVAEAASVALKQLVLKGRQAGYFVILSTQNVKADDLSTTLRDNMMMRITVGRLSEYSYGVMFGEENKDKHFKYVEKDHQTGEKIFGRGYIGVSGLPAREFYAPLLPDSKEYTFYDDFESLPRIEGEVLVKEKQSEQAKEAESEESDSDFEAWEAEETGPELSPRQRLKLEEGRKK